MPMDDLLHEVLIIHELDSPGNRISNKPIDPGKCIVKLVKKVKKLEGFLKRRNLVLSDSEEEEPEELILAVLNLVLFSRELLSTRQEQVSTVGAEKSTSSQDKGQREGKAPMLSEETPKKSKEQILQEEASLAEAIRLDSLQKEEEAKQIHLDSLLAQRIAE
ncbi:hypothetical protein Tco_0365481 [Tanacetum coccineum]